MFCFLDLIDIYSIDFLTELSICNWPRNRVYYYLCFLEGQTDKTSLNKSSTLLSETALPLVTVQL